MVTGYGIPRKTSRRTFKIFFGSEASDVEFGDAKNSGFFSIIKVLEVGVKACLNLAVSEGVPVLRILRER
jgi:hypothetical protein